MSDSSEGVPRRPLAFQVADLLAERDELEADRDRLRGRVRELMAPPRGIGGQQITLSDVAPTYADLLAHYYRQEEQGMETAADLHRTRAHRDELAGLLREIVDYPAPVLAVDLLQRARRALGEETDR